MKIKQSTSIIIFLKKTHFLMPCIKICKCSSYLICSQTFLSFKYDENKFHMKQLLKHSKYFKGTNMENSPYIQCMHSCNCRWLIHECGEGEWLPPPQYNVRVHIFNGRKKKREKHITRTCLSFSLCNAVTSEEL